MKVALSEGRLSRWQELFEELTPHDMAVLAAFSRICPFGPDRDDLRAAVNTSALIAAWGGEPNWEALAGYMSHKKDLQHPEGASPNAVAMMMTMARPRTGHEVSHR
jgi:hypothetical protein